MKFRVTVIAILIGTSIAFAQQKGVSGDTLKTRELEEVFVSATRAGEDTPMAYSNVDAKQLKSVNLGQDLPILLNLVFCYHAQQELYVLFFSFGFLYISYTMP